ncbi:MAG: hypothetical protein ABJA94_06680 [Rhodoglobus sp.]
MAQFELRWVRTGIPAAHRAEYLALLSAAERERYDAAEPAGDSFLAGRVLLRHLASELTGVPAEDVRIEAAICRRCERPHGAPGIPGSDLRLSLSRCATAIVAVAAWHRAVGVDVEPRRDDPERDAAIGVVAGVPSLRHWTRVEAVLKADGSGLTADPGDVRVGRAAARFDGARYRLFEPEVAADLQVSVAVGARKPR